MQNLLTVTQLLSVVSIGRRQVPLIIKGDCTYLAAIFIFLKFRFA
jgi:hypothetical protein